MIKHKKSFCIVCVANYCRSPVVENILKNRFQDKYEFFSAGLSPISLPNMDPRSLEFLKNYDVRHDFHIPKKINKKMLNHFDKFLAVDLYVLKQLNNTYPKFKHKFQSLTNQFDEINIIDPYRFETNEYIRTMEDIKYVAEKINLEEV